MITCHNLSKLEIDQTTVSALAKGFNSAVALSKIPTENIICGVETVITAAKIQVNTADEIRHVIARILQTKPPKRNISQQELNAMKSLKSNKAVLVLPADKENATVITDREEYDGKIKLLLDDPAYKPISTDPTT